MNLASSIAVGLALISCGNSQPILSQSAGDAAVPETRDADSPKTMDAALSEHDAAPKQVGPITNCIGLTSPGKWEQVAAPAPPLAGAMGILSALVDPQNPTVLYVTSDKQGLFRTADCGASWTKVNTGRNGAVLDSGSQWMFLIDPTDDKTMYTSPLFGSDQRLFKSTNGGVDWDPLFQTGDNVESALEYVTVQDLAIDPTNNLHLALTFHSNCKAPYTQLCLAQSTDGGTTWELFNGPPTLSGWTEDAGPYLADANTIFFAGSFDGLFVTTDKGKNWKQLTKGGYCRIFHSADGYYYMGSAQLSLQRSKDLITWETIKNTPSTISAGLAEDGQRLFLASRSYVDYESSPQSDGLMWTSMTAPSVSMTAGPRMLAVDSVNHVLYSGNLEAGLWRQRTY